MISLEDLSFQYEGATRQALRDINLRIEPGEFVVLTGPSGCGKSTLALALGGYLFRQFDGQVAGRVHVNGLDARRDPIHDVAEIVGLVQQNPEAQFCTLTVEDEIAFGLENRRMSRSRIERRMRWALDIVGASHLRQRTLSTLSGGEQQKIAIAAMMAAKPQVLIFDEPTSNLDPAATATIFDVIRHIREVAGITVIVIEHKIDYLLSFDPRLVVMDRGSIMYDGRACHLLEHKRRELSELGLRLPGNDLEGAPHAASRDVGRVLAQVDQVRLGYGDRVVLEDVSLDIHAGQIVAVMGDNGSGKSTFLRSLLGLLKPQAGRILVLGRDTLATPVSTVARQVGFVFQNPDHQLFADSVGAEVAMAPRNFGLYDVVTRQRIDTLLVQTALDGYRDQHPYRLSYGEKRRLNLISILSYQPQLILLDEPFIGQDWGHARLLLRLLRDEAQRGATVLWITHDPALARAYADRMLFFSGGRLNVDAPAEEGFGALERMGRANYLPKLAAVP